MSYGSVDDMMFDEKRMGRDIQSGHDEEDGIEGAKFDKDLHNTPQWSENKRLHQLCKGDILVCRRPAPASAGGRSKSSASTSSSSKRTRGGGEKGAGGCMIGGRGRGQGEGKSGQGRGREGLLKVSETVIQEASP